MEHFYLHLHECGDVIADEQGQELPDLEAARQIAIASARDVMCAEVAEGRLCLGCSIEISDHNHVHVLSVLFREAVKITGL